MERSIGELYHIYISPEKGQPMRPVKSALALARRGLAGDRYAEGKGAYSGSKTMPDSDRQVSLISLQAIFKANEILSEKEIPVFQPEETRRNLVLGIDPEALNKLVNKKFLLGEVEMEGVDLCDPCTRPALVLGRAAKDGHGFEEAFQRRGGLRARIITSGILIVGDELKFSNP